MSGFTLGLVILGGLVLALLVAWNAWTTRNAPRRRRRSSRRAPRPVPMEPSSTEPVFDADLPRAAAGARAQARA